MGPVAGRHVFSHTPAKSMLQERAQEAVLRKFGPYKPLELCYQASKPWGRFFICDKDFVAYNRAGMRAEDPTAHKWSASKLWIDYTPFVKALDWTKLYRSGACRMNKILDTFSESARKINPPRHGPRDAHAAAVEAPAAARATTLKERDAMTTPLIQTMVFGIGM